MSASSLSSLPSLEEIRAEKERRGIKPSLCLWPAPFNEDTPESGWLFVQECRSYLETTGEILHIPAEEYLEGYCYLWHEAKRDGRTLFTQKCRRMVISWEARALELHQMGLSRCDQVLAGEDLEQASKHVWRLKHLYTDLQLRHQDWRLPPHSELRYEGERKLKMFGLANGSICNYANGQAGGLQGDGTRIITMEEPAQFRYLANMVAQAQILTMGPGSRGRSGTLVNLISNTPEMGSPASYDFAQLKKGWEEISPRP